MKNLTPAELKLASKLLELAADHFNNLTCNDFDLTFLPLEERQEVLSAYHSWDGTLDWYDENEVDLFNNTLLMAYLSDRLAQCIPE